ncbi:glycosyltransferase family 4 protein, partial [Patescibacteria group bacterium]|nr:glycosyltransferase family 4 protein [Patescibacteria group bacterium]
SIISEYKTFLSSMSFPKDIVSFVKNTGFTLKNFFRRQREFVHGSDKVICVSNFVKTALIEETFALDDKFVVIHNGIDSQPFSNNADAPVSRQRKLLFVGQILKSKGMDDVLSLALDARFSDVSIDVIGSGDYFEEFSNKLKDAGVLDRVHMFGKLPYTEVINVYKNSGASVFIFPTKRIEGFPMVLVEAMFAGLPIIAYSMGGVSDAVVDGKTGYLLSANDINTFKDRILELLENKNLCAEFSVNAQSLAMEQFSVKSMIMNYESVLTEVFK